MNDFVVLTWSLTNLIEFNLYYVLYECEIIMNLQFIPSLIPSHLECSGRTPAICICFAQILCVLFMIKTFDHTQRFILTKCSSKDLG